MRRERRKKFTNGNMKRRENMNDIRDMFVG